MTQEFWKLLVKYVSMRSKPVELTFSVLRNSYGLFLNCAEIRQFKLEIFELPQFLEEATLILLFANFA